MPNIRMLLDSNGVESLESYLDYSRVGGGGIYFRF